MNNFGIKYSTKKKFRHFNEILSYKKSDVVIEVKSCGMCGSDNKIFNFGSNRVKNGRVTGHEISGKVNYISHNNRRIKIGDNIVLGADIENKYKKDFAFGHEIDGGFQKYLKFKKEILKDIPLKIFKKKINYDHLALTEPLACCINGFEKVNPDPKKTYLIFGGGSIGLLLSKLALYHKAKKVLIIEKNEQKVRNFKNSKRISMKSVKSLKNKRTLNTIKGKIDYVFVACNSFEAQEQSLEIVKKGGIINFFSGIKGQSMSKLNTNLIHYKELKIVGSHGSSKKHIVKSAELIDKKKIKVGDIISHKLNIAKFEKALKLINSSTSTKIIIKF